MTKLEAEIDFLAGLLEMVETGELQIITYPSGNGWRDSDTRYLAAIKNRLSAMREAHGRGGATSASGRIKSDDPKAVRQRERMRERRAKNK